MCFFISSQPKLCFRCCFVCLCLDRVLRGCVTSISAHICAFSYPVIPNLFRCGFVCLCLDRVLRGCVTSVCAFSYPVSLNRVLGAILFVCVGIEFYEAASLVYVLLYVLFHIQSFQTVF